MERVAASDDRAERDAAGGSGIGEFDCEFRNGGHHGNFRRRNIQHRTIHDWSWSGDYNVGSKLRYSGWRSVHANGDGK